MKFFKKILSKFSRGEEEKKKTFTKGLVIGIIVAIVILVIVLVIVLPKILGSGSGVATAKNPAKLKVTIITQKDCTGCWDVNLLLDAIKEGNVKIADTKTLYTDSANTKKLIDQYKITKIPTILVSGDLNKDPNMQQLWTALGEIVDGTFVFRQVIPPYIDIASGQLKGKITLTYLTDNSCKECYDVHLHDTALKNLAIVPGTTKTLDISSDEGKALVAKYQVKAVPTMLISGEVGEYKNLTSIWEQVGTVASDGTYIFTKAELMGTYKDLSKNKIIVPPVATSTSVQ
ncbi:MAG: hypothetical protein WC244_00710 [Patescibacteria group bacterium]|jgi:hypothetical protein